MPTDSNKMIPKILHQVWFGEPNREFDLRTMDTLQKHDDWKYYRWNEYTTPELGLNVRKLKEQFTTWAGVSNVVRLAAVLKHGGVYLDCDIACIKPLDPLLDCRAFAATQDYLLRVCNAVFGAEANNEWTKWQFDRYEKHIGKGADWGVHLMTDASVLFSEYVKLYPPHFFYPWTWTTKPKDRKIHPDGYLVHHWKASWVGK